MLAYESELVERYKAVRIRLSPPPPKPSKPPKIQVIEITEAPPAETICSACKVSLVRSNSIARAKEVCCEYFGVSKYDMDGIRRTGPLIRARHIAMYLAKRTTTCSLPQIGRHFGNRDHTTVLSGIRKIEALRLEYPKLDELLTRLEAECLA